MKKFIKTFLFAGVAFGILFGLFMGLIQLNIVTGILAGVVGGVLFGLIIGLFTGFQSKKFHSADASIPDLVYSGGANHFVNGEAIGGWLQLTNNQLIFKPHNINFQKQEWSVQLHDILSVRPVRTLGIVPNGLSIQTHAGQERFVVSGRRQWIDKILSTKSSM